MPCFDLIQTRHFFIQNRKKGVDTEGSLLLLESKYIGYVHNFKLRYLLSFIKVLSTFAPIFN